MIIQHLSFSRSGGAGQVARILAKQQRMLGHKSELSYLLETDLWSEPFKDLRMTTSATLDKYLVSRGDWSGLTSFYRRRQNRANRIPITPNGPLHFHWIEGVLSHHEIARIVDSGRPVVWTLHDMAPFTGGCHHSLGCDGYKKECKGCPAVRIPFRLGVEKSQNRAKTEIKSARNFQLVSPSAWLAEKAQASSVFSGFEVKVIENPIDPVFFTGHSKSEERRNLGLSDADLVCAVVASQLDNPHKGISNFASAFFSLANNLGVAVKLLLIGSGGERIKEVNPGVVLVGSGDSGHVAKSLCTADFLVSVSRAESSGLVIREAGALSVPALVVSNGGSDELIQDEINGLVFDSMSSLLTGLSTLITNPHFFSQMGLAASIQAEKSAKPSTSANRYLDLYENLYRQ